MKVLELKDFESFDAFYKEYEQKKSTNDLKNLLLLFEASDEPTTKESWCSDCRKSRPIIDKIIQDFQYNEELVLAFVKVGSRDEWKNSENPFRNHDLQITAVPTLVSLKMGKRLVEGECADLAKVSHLFSNSM